MNEQQKKWWLMQRHLRIVASSKGNNELNKDYNFTQSGGDLIYNTNDEVPTPEFKLVEGNLIYVYPDGTQPLDLSINRDGNLIQQIAEGG